MLSISCFSGAPRNDYRLAVCTLVLCLMAGGCARQSLAPLREHALPGQAVAKVKVVRAAKKPAQRIKRRVVKVPSHYLVKAGDTLQTIAWRYHLDVKDIATWNTMPSPDVIKVGQLIRLKRPIVSVKPKQQTPTVKTVVRVKKIAKKPSRPRLKDTASATPLKISWIWPTNGKVVQKFDSGQLRKGLDISGREGQTVVAAADGEVVYSNNNLRGYGNLVIIKHSENILSAYAYNKTLVVTEKDRIRKGQQIATMGVVGNNKAILHFEIRKLGEPVNPLHYLPKR